MVDFYLHSNRFGTTTKYPMTGLKVALSRYQRKGHSTTVITGGVSHFILYPVRP